MKQSVSYTSMASQSLKRIVLKQTLDRHQLRSRLAIFNKTNPPETLMKTRPASKSPILQHRRLVHQKIAQTNQTKPTQQTKRSSPVTRRTPLTRVIARNRTPNREPDHRLHCKGNTIRWQFYLAANPPVQCEESNSSCSSVKLSPRYS